MHPVFLSVYCMFPCTKRTFFKFCSFLAPLEPFLASRMSPTLVPTPSVHFLYQYYAYLLLSLCASKLISKCLNRAYDIVVSSGPSPWQRWGSHRVVRALQRLQARHRKHWVCGCNDCDLPTGEPPVSNSNHQETPGWKAMHDKWFATVETKKELEPTYVPQLFLGSLLGSCRSAIGQLFFPSLATVPEVFANVSLVRSPSSAPDLVQFPWFLKWRIAITS